VANIQVCLKMAAVVARMQHQRLPVQHRVLDTPTCRAQAYGGQPLIVGFRYQGAQFQPPQHKAHLPKAHQVVRAVARHQVLALLFTLAAMAARQYCKPQPQTSNVAVAVLALLAQAV
jgi:hypothetical protein